MIDGQFGEIAVLTLLADSELLHAIRLPSCGLLLSFN